MIHAARSQRQLPGEGYIDIAGLFAELPKNLPISVEVIDTDRIAKLVQTECAQH